MVQNSLLLVLTASGLIGLLFLYFTLKAISRFRILPAFQNTILMLLCFLVATTAGLFFVIKHSYQPLTKETLAAIIEIKPQGKQQFVAQITLPDSTKSEYSISGDIIYIDAHILKWHPALNLIGIHTGYKLDRIGGRYNTLSDEQKKPRSIYSLGKNTIIDSYSLQKCFFAFKPLLNAQYGSATFIGAQKTKTLHLMVTTSGLLVR